MKRRFGHVTLAWVAILGAVLGAQTSAGIYSYPADWWYDAGRGDALESRLTFANASGKVGVVDSGGGLDTKGHPFFEPLGRNGRACVTCHQPAAAMSLSAAMARERWRVTEGHDPLFAAIDGSNNPALPQADRRSHSLLLDRGLIRVFLPWPPVTSDGSAMRPEFSIEVVRDPTGVNLDPVHGLKSAHPTVSVFRRPRPAANLKYVMTPDAVFNIKLGILADTDPDTGLPVGMNMMADARHATLKQQAVAAAAGHLELVAPLTADQQRRIVDYESRLYMAQVSDTHAGNLVEPGGPPGLGPDAMAAGTTHVLGNKLYNPVFLSFDAWRSTVADVNAQRAARASIARGSDVFMKRQFWIRDVTHMNSIGLGNPIKRTCASCHNAQMTGQDLAPGWMDLGTNNYPRWTEPGTWTESAELPVFKITCDHTAPPHPYLGRVIYTTDPGRALISGKCADVGAIVMQQLRGLAARAPYFANGGAKTLREVVDFYDRRFDMKLTEQEKQDLVNFLAVL